MLDLEFGRREREIDAPEHILFSIDPSDLQHDFLDPSSTHFPKVRFSFDIPHSLLLVKMSSPEHGAAIGALSTEVAAQLALMGPNTRNEITAFSGSGIRAEGKGKAADFAWGPVVPPAGAGAAGSVTVAVEVAVSQTPTMLKRDIDYWLSPTAGNANLAIGMKVSRTEPEVSIEMWRQASKGPHRTQHTTISKKRNTVTVSGDPVIIPFLDLFGRAKLHPAETDVTISEDQLRILAQKIWNQQGF
jgi:hypothetical protein